MIKAKGKLAEWLEGAFNLGILVVYGYLFFACWTNRNLTGLAILFGCFLYVRLRATAAPLEDIRQQLRNLYMLLAFDKRTDPLSPLGSDPSKTLMVDAAEHKPHLERWEQNVLHHFLASGLAPEEAFGAYLDTTNSYAKFIAKLAPERIKNACNAGIYNGPCEACAKAIADAKNRFEEILAEEKKRKAILRPWEYSIVTPLCPLPKNNIF